MNQQPIAELRRRRWAALVCAGLSVFISYIVWTRHPGLRVPPAIGYLAAGVFAAAAVALLLQARGQSRAALVPVFLLNTALAGIGGWIAFAPGVRRCDGSLGGTDFMAAEIVCRAGFGVGALLTAFSALLVVRTRPPPDRGR